MPCKMERYFFYLLYLLLGCSLCGCSRKQAPKQAQDPDTETTIPYADTIAAPVPPAPVKSRTARYLDSLGFVNITEADSSIAIDLMYTRADNFTGVPAPQALVFTRRQEKERACPYTPQLKSYLYEPNASVLKAGAFRSLSSLYKVEKLHPNSHLYTSGHFLPDFPGRKFQITSSCGFGKKEVKEMLAAEKKANLTVRNFPATVAELRKRLKLAEGGGTYLFATTLADEKKVLIRCQATG